MPASSAAADACNRGRRRQLTVNVGVGASVSRVLARCVPAGEVVPRHRPSQCGGSTPTQFFFFFFFFDTDTVSLRWSTKTSRTPGRARARPGSAAEVVGDGGVVCAKREASLKLKVIPAQEQFVYRDCKDPRAPAASVSVQCTSAATARARAQRRGGQTGSGTVVVIPEPRRGGGASPTRLGARALTWSRRSPPGAGRRGGRIAVGLR